MPNFTVKLYHHPDQNELANILASNLSEETGTLFSKQTVITQSPGIATWLRQQFASKFGICSGIEFVLPRSFFLESLSTDSSEHLADQSYLTWSIFQLLPTVLKESEFSILKRYCMSDDTLDELKLYEFSFLIASLFESYTIYRADMIEKWETQPLSSFQSLSTLERIQISLWKKLRDFKNKTQTWSDLLKNSKLCIEENNISTSEAVLSNTLKPIHVFGITHLPTIFIDILHAISNHREVSIYWQNPVFAHEGYWEDSPNHKQWILNTITKDQESIIFNPLLATFGKSGREFISTLYTGTNSYYDIQNIQLEAPREDTVLNTLNLIQKDIAENTFTATNIDTDNPSDSDNSVQVHNSFSALREVESLRLHLLSLLKKSPSTDLSEIIVLMPQIEPYVTSIEAVFGCTNFDDSSHIPYRVCDRVSPSDEPLVELFLTLLKLDQSHFTANEVIAFTEQAFFAENFQISPDSIQQINKMVRHVGIVWGKDEAHTLEMTDTEYQSYHTWKMGLERLLLGFMVESPDTTPSSWDGISAAPNIQESDLHTIRSLITLLSTLDEISTTLTKKRTFTDWVQQSRQWLKLYFTESQSTQRALQKINQALDNCLNISENSAFSDKISSTLFHEVLLKELTNSSSALGFLSGSITFCELKPMRSIPHKAVCILGLNYGDFPRKISSSSLDLITKDRRVGDRSSRDDDQYAFLEAILSAKGTLYLSYTGQSEKSNELLSPATPLQILMSRYPSLKSNEVRHPLHRHDSFYFNKTAPLSPDYSDYALAQFSRAEYLIQPSEPIPCESASILESQLTPEAFIHFFTQYPANKLAQLAQARTPWIENPLDDIELLHSNNLDSYKILQFLQKTSLEEDPSDIYKTTYQYLLQNNLLPYGENGKSKFSHLFKDIEEMQDHLNPIYNESIDLKLDKLHLTGVVQTSSNNPVHIQIPVFKAFNKVDSAKDKIILYLKASILSCQLDKEIQAELIYLKGVSRPAKPLLITPEKALKILTTFEEIYWMCNQQNVPFLLYSLEKYLAHFKKEADINSPFEQMRAMQKAYSTGWLASKQTRGEESDLRNLLLFDGEKPYNPSFLKVATLLHNLEIL